MPFRQMRQQGQQRMQPQYFCDAITDCYHEQDATSVVAEDQSLITYKRMRMAESFETPQQKKKRRTQCPSKPRKQDTITWDKETVLRDLQN